MHRISDNVHRFTVHRSVTGDGYLSPNLIFENQLDRYCINTSDLDSYRYLEEVLVPMVSDREQYYDALKDIPAVLTAGGVEDPAMKQTFSDAAEELVSLKDSIFVGNEGRSWAESMGIGREET